MKPHHGMGSSLPRKYNEKKQKTNRPLPIRFFFILNKKETRELSVLVHSYQIIEYNSFVRREHICRLRVWFGNYKILPFLKDILKENVTVVLNEKCYCKR